jgi:hypothetical protein
MSPSLTFSPSRAISLTEGARESAAAVNAVFSTKALLFIFYLFFSEMIFQ